MKTIFFTLVNDRYYDGVGTEKMIHSFKYFHPDIPLVVYRQNMIDKVFKEKGINFYNAKPTFAKLLTPYYDLVVNIDADHIVLARLDEILKGDYDVGGPWNLNDYENRAIENLTKEQYVQGGMVAATNKRFWDIWEEANKGAMKYRGRENDIMNLVWYNDPEVNEMNKVIFDKDNNMYYGCKSLNREKEFYMEDNKVMCRGGQVKLYHHAKGGHLPKLVFEEMGFPPEVVKFMNKVSNMGITKTYEAI
jgi:hypothetical protein